MLNRLGSKETADIGQAASKLRFFVFLYNSRLASLRRMINPRTRTARTMSQEDRAEMVEALLAKMTIDLKKVIGHAVDIRAAAVAFIDSVRSDELGR